MILTRRGALGAFAAASLATLAACGSDAGGSSGRAGSGSGGDLAGAIKGAGATSQADAQEAWMNAFMDANPDASVEYAGGGSGAGVTKFTEGAVDYAGTDSPLSVDDISAAGGDVVELPLYISPIAVAYNVPGFTGDTHINMTGEVIAKVFNGDITMWNDAEIAALNEGADLPELAIVTVHRSDESGTTENFAMYMVDVAFDVWIYEPEKTWPIEGGQSGDGTSGMITTISAAEGTIGYADASKVTADLGTVAVGSDGNFTPYSTEAAAATVDASELSADATDTQIVYDIDHEAADAYPIILVSYLIAHQSYDDADIAAAVKGFLTYVASEDGQKAAAEAAGSAPISEDLRAKITAAIETIEA